MKKKTCGNFQLISTEVAVEELKSFALKMNCSDGSNSTHSVLVKAPAHNLSYSCNFKAKFTWLSCLQISLGTKFVLCSHEMSLAALKNSGVRETEPFCKF